MINYIKKTHLGLISSLLFSLCSFSVYADTWELEDLVARNTEQSVPYFFYVGKAEAWQNIQFNSQFDVQGTSTIVVRYDNQIIYKQNINGKGEINFPVPPSNSGFHRLDFMVLQKPLSVGQESNSFCLESNNLYTALLQPNLTYQVQQKILQLSQLPDALFNSQLSRSEPIQALLRFNSGSLLESSMMVRLASAWNFATPVEWQVNQSPSQPTDFVIAIQRVSQPLTGAKISISQVDHIPTLNIEYSSESQLLMAVNALLNRDYLPQLNTVTATLNGPVARPTWATLRKFETLADLGITDFTIENWPKNISLIFPPVWDATDILKGQMTFRAQSGLLQGSTLQIWINEYLAGSMSLAKLDSNPIDRQFDFVGADYPYTTSYNITLKNNQLNNENCLPNAGVALWVDAKKSQLNLSHQMKKGVINISSSFVNTPEIAVNNTLGTNIAISIANVAKKMLLSNDPIDLNIIAMDLKAPKAINIQVDSKQFKAQLQKYSQILYLPVTTNGFLITVKNEKFWIYTDNVLGTQNFVRFWPEIQQNIPNNTTALFVSAQGQVTVLSQTAVENIKAPTVKQISIRTITIILIAVILILISLILWRRSRKTPGANEE